MAQKLNMADEGDVKCMNGVFLLEITVTVVVVFVDV